MRYLQASLHNQNIVEFDVVVTFDVICKKTGVVETLLTLGARAQADLLQEAGDVTALDAAFQLRHVLVAQAAVHVDVIVVQ